MDADSPLAKAIRLAGGSEAKLAAGIGFSQVAVNKAKRRGSVSPRMAVAIDLFLKGAVSKSDLRPDLWPPVERELVQAAGASA